MRSPLLSVSAMVAYAIVVVLAARHACDRSRLSASWILLPVAASLDNLTAGSLLGVTSGLTACLSVLASTTVSMAGLTLAGTLPKGVPLSPARLASRWPQSCAFYE
jgi:hypothetical protein